MKKSTKQKQKNTFITLGVILAVLIGLYISPIGSILGLKAPEYCSEDHFNPECYCRPGEVALTINELIDLGEDTSNEGVFAELSKDNYRVCKPYEGWISSKTNDPELYTILTQEYGKQLFTYYCPEEPRDVRACEPTPPYFIDAFSGINSQSGREVVNIECRKGSTIIDSEGNEIQADCMPIIRWSGFGYTDEEFEQFKNLPLCKSAREVSRIMFYQDNGKPFINAGKVQGCYFNFPSVEQMDYIIDNCEECYISPNWLKEQEYSETFLLERFDEGWLRQYGLI